MKLIIRNNGTAGLMGGNLRGAVSEFFDRVFDREFLSTGLFQSDFNPKVDVYEKDNRLFVKADVPGIDEKDISVTVEDGFMTISGKKEEENEVKEKGFYRMERSSGSFCRTVELPENADLSGIDAQYKKGVLTVNMPLTGKEQAKKISVKVS